MSDVERGRSLARSLRALQDGVQQAGPAAAAGYTLIGAILFLGGLGYGFDRWQGTAPTGLVVGMLAGVGAGLYLQIRELGRRRPR